MCDTGDLQTMNYPSLAHGGGGVDATPQVGFVLCTPCF